LIFAILRSHLLRAGISNGRKFGALIEERDPRSRGYSIDFRGVKVALVLGLKPHAEVKGGVTA
jgi:hypothetical protein